MSDDGCCHKTRIKDGPCPIGWKCPYIKDNMENVTSTINKNYGPLPGTNRTGVSSSWIDVVIFVCLGFWMIVTITEVIVIIVG